MTDCLVTALAAMQRRNDLIRAHNRAETWLAPKEINALLGSAADLPQQSRAWLEKLSARVPGVREQPQNYERQRLHADVDLYSNPEVPSRNKRLILAFSGGQRLFLPTVAVLQNIPSERFDVAVLREEPPGQQFLNGIPGYAESLPRLLSRLSAELRVTEYSGLICYGTSAGGFAALRGGLLLGAERAVAVGGRFQGHVKRLTGETGPAVPAFDPLCDCVATPSQTSLISIYAEYHRTDALHHEQLSRMRHVRSVAVPIRDHNVVHDALKRGQLKEFLAFALGSSDSLSWLPPPEEQPPGPISLRAAHVKRAWDRRRNGGLGRAQALGSLVVQGMRRLAAGGGSIGSP